MKVLKISLVRQNADTIEQKVLEISNMKVYSWSSVVEFFTRRMFVTDKHRRIIFFPWGTRGKGYILKNKAMKEKVGNFYTSWVLIYFLSIFLLAGRFQNYLSIIGVILVTGLILSLIWYGYSWNITRDLSVTRAGYKEIVLDKVSLDSEREDSHGEGFKSPKTSKPVSTKADPFLNLKLIYYRLTPTQLFFVSFSIGIAIIVVWMTFYPLTHSWRSEEWLIAALVSFFWGLSGYFVVSRIETSGWVEFILLKSGYFLIMLFFWIGALFCLFKFFVR